VYVARTQTPRRNVLNQVELIKRLSQIGVPTYEFKFENFLEQIAVFRKAKLIITPHGAALSNIIWSPAGQNILELFSLNRRHKLFLQMAAQHELNYNLLFGSETSGNDNFQAPIEEIIGFIDRYRTAKK
jgi:capsular polysaccharide biosynthesis protein